SFKTKERPSLRSVNTVTGFNPALRRRVPSRDPSAKNPSSGLASIKHGFWRKPVGENLEATTGKPQELVMLPAGTTLGRAEAISKSKVWSTPVTISNGRPALNSTIGATVQWLIKFFQNPSPTLPL